MNGNNQAAMERATYEVPGAQFRYRAAQLNSAGLQYDATYQPAERVYIVVVTQPAGLDPFAQQPARRPKTGIELPPVLKWVTVVAAVTAIAAVAAVLYLAFSPSDQVTAEVGGMRLDPVTGHMVEDGGLWGWLPDLQLPWQAAEEPAEQGDFRWPWDAAADAAESVQSTVTVVSAGVLGFLVLLIILALLGKRRR